MHLDCIQESLSFDPFTSLSVPVSKRTAVDVIVMYRTDGKPSIKVRATVETLELLPFVLVPYPHDSRWFCQGTEISPGQ